VSRAKIFALIPMFMKGTQATQKSITMGKAHHVVVTAIEGVLPAHADGETLCEDGKQLAMELLAHQIKMVCKLPETTH